jgi:hypothetical protein
LCSFWIDFAAIVPYFVYLFMYIATGECYNNNNTMAILRVLRVVRTLKLSKHSQGLKILAKTLRASMNELFLFALCLGQTDSIIERGWAKFGTSCLFPCNWLTGLIVVMFTHPVFLYCGNVSTQNVTTDITMKVILIPANIFAPSDVSGYSRNHHIFSQNFFHLYRPFIHLYIIQYTDNQRKAQFWSYIS